jgi:hypothetical protein
MGTLPSCSAFFVKYFAGVFHWWIYLFLFLARSKLVNKLGIVCRLRSYASISQSLISIFLFEKHFIFLPLDSLSLGVVTIEIRGVLKPKFFITFHFYG